MNEMEKTKKVVLVADDDIDYLTEMTMVVENFGFKVVKANSRKEAEKILETLKPDLCIFDLMMETQDAGFVLAYKTKKKYPETKIIIVSAVTAETGILFKIETEEDRNWIKADLYLEKGIRYDQLEREINKLLKI